jgi:hypothetical protein
LLGYVRLRRGDVFLDVCHSPARLASATALGLSLGAAWMRHDPDTDVFFTIGRSHGNGITD